MFSLNLFGGASLQGPGGALTGRAAQRHRLALLALLATPGTGGMSRDKLIAYLWPEVDAERGRHLLSNSLYVLRQALGEEVLIGSADTVRLDHDRLRCDVREFEDALARGELERAVGLYGGPFLDGFFLSEVPEFERWMERERERLTGAYARALEALAEVAEGNADSSRAAEWWKARAALDPYDSRVALRLMRALEAGGNRAGALQYGAVHQRLLQEELGVNPAHEVAALAERLRSEPRTASLAPGRAADTQEERSEEPRIPSVVEPEVPAAAPAVAVEDGTTHRRTALRAGGLLAMLTLLGALWALRPFDAAPERSVVVLPFINMSPDEANEYFADGLAEEIITRLSAVPELKVISRTSAMHYKGSDAPVRQIAAELDVAHVLEGSVRKSGGRLRITAQLIDARADEHRWAANYEVEPGDMFAVQEKIAQEVVRALEVELGERTRGLLARQGTHDSLAYEFYRRGRFLSATRTPEGQEKALEYFQRAIERDSNYADAYAGLADVYLVRHQLFGRPEAEAYSRVKWAAERALALDERSADAHTSFAVSLWWQHNWPGAERELLRAIELNPGHAIARGWYALLLGGMGRLEEALEQSRRATELDPFGLVGLTYAFACYYARDYDRAVEQFRNALEIHGSRAGAQAGLGLTYAQKGMAEAAIREVSKAVEQWPGNPSFLGDLAYVHAVAGQKAEAELYLQRAKARLGEDGSSHPSGAPFSIARAHVALDQPDSAFFWLDRVSWQWPHRGVRTDPALDPLRADPRFTELVVRVDRELGLR